MSGWSVTTPDACLACGSPEIEQCLDLGRQPPANLLASGPDVQVEAVSLRLVHCRSCGHGQLGDSLDPEHLFSHYLYRSGTSGTLRAYFDWFCEQTSTTLPPGGRVLEIAANDGSLLTRFADAGFDCVGIDPARNIVEPGQSDRLRMVCDFFPSEAIAGERFDLVLGLNVLAHTPDPLTLLRAAGEQLGDGGIAIFQTSQALMLRNGEFDTIYHEHYSFFTPRSLEELAKRAGLHLLKVTLTDIHGTSFAFVLSREPAAARVEEGLLESGRFAIPASERAAGLAVFESDMSEPYAAFARKARERIADVRGLVEDNRAAGRSVVMVGVAAKAITFVRAAGLEFDHAYDEARDKIGMFIPGLDLEIEDLRAVEALTGPTLFVLTAWNFAAELERKVRERASGCEPEFLTYFPEVASW